MRRSILAGLFALWSALPVQAQTLQVWPEVSAFARLNDKMRFYFLATTVKEERESTEGEFGPNLDFYLKPVRNPKHIVLHLDDSKNRVLMVRVGYRYLKSYSGDPDEHRGVLEATARYPLAAGILFSNRGRIDLRFIDGEESWRFRNRLSAEKELAIGAIKVSPYVRAEVFYDSRPHEWSRTALSGGAAFPIRRRFELEGYFEHQNDTGGENNRQVNSVGAVLNLYF